MNEEGALSQFIETKGDEFVLEEIAEHDGGMWDFCVTSVILKHIPTGRKFKLTAEFDDHCYDVGIGVEVRRGATYGI